jgi:hypothetical protein
MQFVDYRCAKWMLERVIAFPVERTQISNNALHRGRCVVSRVTRSGTIIVLSNGNTLAIWVNQHFVAVKSISSRRIARPIDAVSVELAGHDSWYKDVPIMRSAIDCWTELYDSGRLLGVGVIK